MEDKHDTTIDRIMCDPHLRREFDLVASSVAPGHPAYVYRKAALNLRKGSRLKPELLSRITAQVPLKRLGEMAEIAHAVRFVIENDFVNGRTIEVDGGLRL